ncbi:unnamed protein product [Adineta steineri]|uniref:Apple domain-containing protein n=1 Tax=Adineta steineri TaxID=433720 RepID=A0A815MYM4_9BILA|nr:unnamed protein product [Adineta steineri]
MALVAIVAKHPLVATHNSYNKGLHRRFNGYNHDKDEQYNMFFRHVVQQLADDEDSEESFRATMRKRVDSVSNDGTILGIGTNNKLYTRATLNSDWIEVPNTMGAVIGVTQLQDGTILGIGTNNKLYTRATLSSDWIEVSNTMGAVIAVTQLHNGTILGIGTNNKLYTRATLSSDWIQVPNTMGAVIGITQLNYPTISAVPASKAATNTASKAATNTASKAATNTASKAATNTASKAATTTAPTSASKAASKAATNTASKAATNTAHLSTSSKCTEIVIGKDNYGGDMDAAHPAQVHSPAACAALCEQYPDCTAWTFNIQSAKCWTKDKTTSLNASPDAITGTCKKSSK